MGASNGKISSKFEYPINRLFCSRTGDYPVGDLCFVAIFLDELVMKRDRSMDKDTLRLCQSALNSLLHVMKTVEFGNGVLSEIDCIVRQTTRMPEMAKSLFEPEMIAGRMVLSKSSFLREFETMAHLRNKYVTGNNKFTRDRAIGVINGWVNVIADENLRRLAENLMREEYGVEPFPEDMIPIVKPTADDWFSVFSLETESRLAPPHRMLTGLGAGEEISRSVDPFSHRYSLVDTPFIFFRSLVKTWMASGHFAQIMHTVALKAACNFNPKTLPDPLQMSAANLSLLTCMQLFFGSTISNIVTRVYERALTVPTAGSKFYKNIPNAFSRKELLMQDARLVNSLKRRPWILDQTSRCEAISRLLQWVAEELANELNFHAANLMRHPDEMPGTTTPRPASTSTTPRSLIASNFSSDKSSKSSIQTVSGKYSTGLAAAAAMALHAMCRADMKSCIRLGLEPVPISQSELPQELFKSPLGFDGAEEAEFPSFMETVHIDRVQTHRQYSMAMDMIFISMMIPALRRPHAHAKVVHGMDSKSTFFQWLAGVLPLTLEIVIRGEVLHPLPGEKHSLLGSYSPLNQSSDSNTSSRLIPGVKQSADNIVQVPKDVIKAFENTIPNISRTEIEESVNVDPFMTKSYSSINSFIAASVTSPFLSDHLESASLVCCASNSMASNDFNLVMTTISDFSNRIGQLHQQSHLSSLTENLMDPTKVLVSKFAVALTPSEVALAQQSRRRILAEQQVQTAQRTELQQAISRSNSLTQKSIEKKMNAANINDRPPTYPEVLRENVTPDVNRNQTDGILIQQQPQRGNYNTGGFIVRQTVEEQYIASEGSLSSRSIPNHNNNNNNNNNLVNPINILKSFQGPPSTDRSDPTRSVFAGPSTPSVLIIQPNGVQADTSLPADYHSLQANNNNNNNNNNNYSNQTSNIATGSLNKSPSGLTGGGFKVQRALDNPNTNHHKESLSEQQARHVNVNNTIKDEKNNNNLVSSNPDTAAPSLITSMPPSTTGNSSMNNRNPFLVKRSQLRQQNDPTAPPSNANTNIIPDSNQSNSKQHETMSSNNLLLSPAAVLNNNNINNNTVDNNNMIKAVYSSPSPSPCFPDNLSPEGADLANHTAGSLSFSPTITNRQSPVMSRPVSSLPYNNGRGGEIMESKNSGFYSTFSPSRMLLNSAEVPDNLMTNLLEGNVHQRHMHMNTITSTSADNTQNLPYKMESTDLLNHQAYDDGNHQFVSDKNHLNGIQEHIRIVPPIQYSNQLKQNSLDSFQLSQTIMHSTPNHDKSQDFLLSNDLSQHKTNNLGFNPTQTVNSIDNNNNNSNNNLNVLIPPNFNSTTGSSSSPLRAALLMTNLPLTNTLLHSPENQQIDVVNKRNFIVGSSSPLAFLMPSRAISPSHMNTLQSPNSKAINIHTAGQIDHKKQTYKNDTNQHLQQAISPIHGRYQNNINNNNATANMLLTSTFISSKWNEDADQISSNLNNKNYRFNENSNAENYNESNFHQRSNNTQDEDLAEQLSYVYQNASQVNPNSNNNNNIIQHKNNVVDGYGRAIHTIASSIRQQREITSPLRKSPLSNNASHFVKNEIRNDENYNKFNQKKSNLQPFSPDQTPLYNPNQYTHHNTPPYNVPPIDLNGFQDNDTPSAMDYPNQNNQFYYNSGVHVDDQYNNQNILYEGNDNQKQHMPTSYNNNINNYDNNDIMPNHQYMPNNTNNMDFYNDPQQQQFHNEDYVEHDTDSYGMDLENLSPSPPPQGLNKSVAAYRARCSFLESQLELLGRELADKYLNRALHANRPTTNIHMSMSDAHGSSRTGGFIGADDLFRASSMPGAVLQQLQQQPNSIHARSTSSGAMNTDGRGISRLNAVHNQLQYAEPQTFLNEGKKLKGVSELATSLFSGGVMQNGSYEEYGYNNVDYDGNSNRKNDKNVGFEGNSNENIENNIVSDEHNQQNDFSYFEREFTARMSRLPASLQRPLPPLRSTSRRATAQNSHSSFLVSQSPDLLSFATDRQQGKNKRKFPSRAVFNATTNDFSSHMGAGRSFPSFTQGRIIRPAQTLPSGAPSEAVSGLLSNTEVAARLMLLGGAELTPRLFLQGVDKPNGLNSRASLMHAAGDMHVSNDGQVTLMQAGSPSAVMRSRFGTRSGLDKHRAIAANGGLQYDYLKRNTGGIGHESHLVSGFDHYNAIDEAGDMLNALERRIEAVRLDHDSDIRMI